jgi:hypothetical protein
MIRVSANYVRAHWAYSELLSPSQGCKYQGTGVPELKDDARRDRPFHDLKQDQRTLLVRQLRVVRSGMEKALDCSTHFQLAHWRKSELASAHIIGHFHQWLPPAYPVGGTTFKEWIEAEPSGPLPKLHPLLDAQDKGPFVQKDPAIAVVLSGSTFLLDGYHRAVRFWTTNDPAVTLAVYVPL